MTRPCDCDCDNRLRQLVGSVPEREDIQTLTRASNVSTLSRPAVAFAANFRLQVQYARRVRQGRRNTDWTVTDPIGHNKQAHFPVFQNPTGYRLWLRNVALTVSYLRG